MKVLISDNLSTRGVDILKKAGLEVGFRSKTSVEEIERVIGDYDAPIIRSATKVTAGLPDKAAKPKVVGRAGSGLDNVDIPVATKKGVVVSSLKEAGAFRGRSALQASPTLTQLLERYREATEGKMTTEQTQQSIDLLLNLEKQKNLSPLMDLLTIRVLD